MHITVIKHLSLPLFLPFPLHLSKLLNYLSVDLCSIKKKMAYPFIAQIPGVVDYNDLVVHLNCFYSV